jgi:hypothetical protein
MSCINWWAVELDRAGRKKGDRERRMREGRRKKEGLNQFLIHW